jgi:cytochrome c556
MKPSFALVALAPLAFASCATTPPGEAHAAARGPNANEVVAARQAAFNLTAATFGGLRGAVESGGEVKPLAFGARGLNRWANALPGMFPAGTQLPESRALPAVWSDRAGFEAQAGDKTAFGNAYKEVGGTCGSCHATYRRDEAR